MPGPSSEVLRQHVWVTNQPMEKPDPPKLQHVLDTLGWIGADRIMFASDCPRRDYDAPGRALPHVLDPATKAAIRHGKSASVYGFARSFPRATSSHASRKFRLAAASW
jgi:predicted TIM-barrel fold metal-dependent hydrolase